MQDRYAGDVGDFGKFALLRALSPERRLGVCWYRTDGSAETSNDGKHLDYLGQPSRFRHLDPVVFDTLRSLADDVRAARRARSIGVLESLQLLPQESLFHGATCPSSRAERHVWASDMVRRMEPASLVFLDPDNGLEGAALGPKSTALAELIAVHRPGRALLLYHHQTRAAGGAELEAA